LSSFFVIGYQGKLDAVALGMNDILYLFGELLRLHQLFSLLGCGKCYRIEHIELPSLLRSLIN
jgi:hypothetical protein